MSLRPVSDHVKQGWEIVGYSVTDASGETYQHSFVLRRQSQHKVLIVRKKMIGEGLVVSEMEV
ncbi:hypothetical protein JIP62_01390 [Brevundimonas vitis]|uniref:DUF1737 domain-containing protein n=1 Tax=Brevundimonas vitisensis TaxID=2800818 RepID=A0ABX7BNK6_9CAUL|nr:hypothetical protein [Brevundimonas vitisensis]QQQ18827.1 hypothetical protein JIP62_01390 [Brevundimonas vitisensis]